MDSLLDSGRVSPVAYNQLNEEFTKIIGKMKDLKETLKHEEDFWRSNLDELLRILERILAGLEFRYISGDIDVEEWEQMRTVLTLGLDSAKNMLNPCVKPLPDPDLPTPILDQKIEEVLHEISSSDFTAETHVSSSPKVISLSKDGKEDHLENAKKSHVKLKPREKARKRSARNRSGIGEDTTLTTAYCRNPWKNDCRNTDIELSIYYKGESLPICRKCWREISEKNLEW